MVFPLTVAAYLWHDPQWPHNSAFTYGPQHVRLLRDMVAKHLTVPHEFACITDQPHLFADMRTIPLDKTTHVPGTCFVKLFTFHPQGRELIGERVLVLDLDTLIVGNMNSIVSRTADLVLWRNPTRLPWDNPIKPGRPYYNTSIILHRCGTMPALWSDFDPAKPGCRDDQWWVSQRLGPHAPYWDGSDGIYRLARADTPGSGVNGTLPDNARVVTFPGDRGKPWLPEVRKDNPWIAQYWPECFAA